MKLVLGYVGKYKGKILLNILCILAWVGNELGLPTVFAYIVDNGLAVNNPDVIWSGGLLMIVLSVLSFAGQILLSISIAKITTSVIRDLRNDLYRHTMTFSHAEFEKFGTNKLITCVTNDSYQVLMFLQQVLRTGFMTPIMFIISMVMMVMRSPSMLATMLAAVLIIGIGIIVIVKVSTPISERQQKGLDRINGQMREMLSGLRVVRSFNREDFETERFEKVSEEYASNSRKLFRLMGAAQPAFFLVFHVVIACIIWISSVQISAGKLEVGDLIAFNEYAFHALFSFLMFANVFMMYPRASVSANRIQDVMNTESSISPNFAGIESTKEHGSIEFDNVSFYYPGEEETQVLTHVSFSVKPGQTVAFIGSTGSGKSTLVKLIPRFFDVTEGRILVDGIDVRDFNLTSLRERIGYIPQKASLFSGTIGENIRFGKHDATIEEVDHAADLAQAKEFIASKDGGYEAHLAEGGANMSGGQKQRLSIARAVLKSPEILIFDDSFSALDFKTDATVRARLAEETDGTTNLIVAQRIGTIMNADNIMVLDEGKLIAQGTHQELMQTCEIYQQIAHSQLSEEDLAQQ